MKLFLPFLSPNYARKNKQGCIQQIPCEARVSRIAQSGAAFPTKSV